MTAFAIGPVRVAPNVILAPMSGITDSILRRTIKEANPGAVGLVVSELISIEATVRHDERTFHMLRSTPIEQPLSIQLFGTEPDNMAEAARIAVDHGASIIDINCGCPVPKIVKKGGGAELMRQSTRLAALVRAVRGAVSVPVTVKIRSGWDQGSRNGVEIARLVEAEGAAMVAIHGRTRFQLYSGESDWEFIAAVKDAVRIPVVGSGDIVDAPTALRRLHESGVDGVMIGRAALANPWIFQQIAQLRAGHAPTLPPPLEAWQIVTRVVERIQAEMVPQAAIGRARGLVCRMSRGLRHSAPLREAVTRAASIDDILALLRARIEAVGSALADAA